jgi:uncharacterized membrane protein YeaQ/YmgE (transglycosylase-associated protein family)
MNIIIWLVIGLIAGWIASVVLTSQNEQGTLMDITLGIIGAFVGGFVANVLGAAGVSGFNLYSIALATVGAILVIGGGKLFSRV